MLYYTIQIITEIGTNNQFIDSYAIQEFQTKDEAIKQYSQCIEEYTVDKNNTIILFNAVLNDAGAIITKQFYSNNKATVNNNSQYYLLSIKKILKDNRDANTYTDYAITRKQSKASILTIFNNNKTTYQTKPLYIYDLEVIFYNGISINTYSNSKPNPNIGKFPMI